MSGQAGLFGDRPYDSIYIVRDAAVDRDREPRLGPWLASVMPLANWRFHLFCTAGGLPEDAAAYGAILRQVSGFLAENPLVTVHLHLLLGMDGSAKKAEPVWERLLSFARPFQREAYEQQGESRLLILPIIAPFPGLRAPPLRAAADFFRERLAKPSFFLRGKTSDGLVDDLWDDQMRFYLDADGGPGADQVMRQLWVNHVFETLVDRTPDSTAGFLQPCRPHLIYDQRRGAAYTCFKRWDLSAPAGGDAPPDFCPGCIGDALVAMSDNLFANRRNAEGRRVCMASAMAFAGEDRHDSAAKAARLAFEKSETDADRAAALVHEGLSCLALSKLEEAEARLELATTFTSDQGLVAYHRGVVQFAWRDYIEALDRFEEALAAGSKDVPEHDLCFQMALCHINLEEYGEARPYLERSERPGDKLAPVAFYRGVCDLAGGVIEEAMGHFREALAIGPAPEDLGRVRFYLGSCHKELEQFDEAIVELQKAVAADPDDPAHHNLLGFCYYKVKRHEEAVACFRRAVEIDPTSGIDWANLGSNLRDLGRIEEAVAMYEKALALDPSIGFARDNLVTLRKLLKEGAE